MSCQRASGQCVEGAPPDIIRVFLVLFETQVALQDILLDVKRHVFWTIVHEHNCTGRQHK